MNYVFFEGDEATSKIVMHDLEKLNNVRIIYRDSAFKSRIFSKLFNLHMSQKINRNFNLPLQEIWFNKLLNEKFKANDDICFVFIAGWYSEKLLSWLRIKYPNGKQVLFLRDTVSVYEKAIPNLEKENLTNIFDLVLTYNPEDAEKYGYVYSPVFISKLDKSELTTYPETDIVFIGVAKDRLPIIHSIFKKLDDIGLKCDFYITNVEKAEQKYPEKIVYSENSISYIDYLGREAASKCILEIIKGDTKGNTYRCWEAVYYNKKLLTNWPGIKDFQFYDSRYMHYFDSVEDIDIKFLLSDYDVEYNYNGENSPVLLLNIIYNNL